MTDSANVNQRQRLIGNAFWNGFPSLFRIAIGFFLVPFILSHIETDLYGIWRICFSVLQISWILQLGMNSSINREVPQGIVRKDFKRISEVISTVMGFYLLLSLVILAGTAVLVVKFPVWFQVPQQYHAASRIIMAITGLGFVFWMPFAVFRALMNGLQAFFGVAIVDIIVCLCYAGLVFVLLKLNYGAITLTLVSILRLILPVVILAVMTKSMCHELHLSLKNAHFSVFKSIFAYGVNSAIYSVAIAFFSQGSVWLTGLLLGTANTAYYSVCEQLSSFIGGVLAITLVITKPAASQFQAENDMYRVQQLLLQSVKYVLMIALPATIFLCIFRSEILFAWLRQEDFVRHSYLIPILAITQVAWLCQQANYFVLNGIGHHRVFAITAVTTTIVGIVFAVVLVNVAKMGLMGIAIGLGVPVVIVALLVMPLYSCKALKISIFHYINVCLMKILIPVIAFTAFLLLWKKLANEMLLMQLLLCMVCSIILLAIGYYVLVLDKNEKKTFFSIVGKILRPIFK